MPDPDCALGLDCDCDSDDCEARIDVNVLRCPPLTRAVGEEPYTFHYSGPGGESVTITDYADMWGGAKSGVAPATPGTWTVTVSGTAGTCILTVEVGECEAVYRQAVAWHSFIPGCHSHVIEDAEWSVSGTGVGIPSSGTTDEDGKYAVLLCGDGDFTFAFEPPEGKKWEPASFTLTKAGLPCPRITGGSGPFNPEAGYLCGCNDCAHPVKYDLLLTTKYATLPINHPVIFVPGSVETVQFEPEARAPITCASGFQYVLEDGPGANAYVRYELTCPVGGDPNSFKVAKHVRILPSFAPDAYGNLVHVGWRMSTAGQQVTGTPVATTPFECETISGSATLPAIEGNFPRWTTGPCFPGAWLGSYPHTIPGSDDLVMLAEAP